MQGVSMEFLAVSWIHRNDNRGPSHGRVFVNLDVLSSVEKGVGTAFSPTVGIDLSLERNPSRRYLLPYFGVESGALFQKDLGRVGIVTPTAGLHVWASPNLFVNLTGGYLLPVSAQHFDDLRGVRAKAGIDFSFW
jgi:hypothetical protein